MIYVLYCLLVLSAYTANLAATLSVINTSTTVSGLADLVAQGLKLVRSLVGLHPAHCPP